MAYCSAAKPACWDLLNFVVLPKRSGMEASQRYREGGVLSVSRPAPSPAKVCQEVQKKRMAVQEEASYEKCSTWTELDSGPASSAAFLVCLVSCIDRPASHLTCCLSRMSGFCSALNRRPNRSSTSALFWMKRLAITFAGRDQIRGTAELWPWL